MQTCPGKSMGDLGTKNLMLKESLEMMYVNTTVAIVQKNISSVATMIDAGHEVKSKKSGSYIPLQKMNRWYALRKVGNTYGVDLKLEPDSSAVPKPTPPPHCGVAWPTLGPGTLPASDGSPAGWRAEKDT